MTIKAYQGLIIGIIIASVVVPMILYQNAVINSPTNGNRARYYETAPDGWHFISVQDIYPNSNQVFSSLANDAWGNLAGYWTYATGVEITTGHWYVHTQANKIIEANHVDNVIGP